MSELIKMTQLQLIDQLHSTCPEDEDFQPVYNKLISWLEDGYVIAVYRNEDMSSSMVGHIQYLKTGKDATFKTPPLQAPDTDFGVGWRYRLHAVVFP